jgi:hypothetical protein
VLDSGFRLFRASFTQVFVLAILASIATVPAGRIANSFSPEAGVSGAAVLSFLAALIVGVIAALVFTAAAAARIDAVANGREMAFGEAVSYGLKRAPAFFVAGLLYGIAVTVGLVLLIIPGIIVGVYMAFGAIATVVDRKGPIEGLKYSWGLVRGRWWRTLILGTVAMLIAMVPYIVIGIVVGVIGAAAALAFGVTPSADGQDVVLLIDLIVTPVVSAFGTPLIYGLGLAIYYDLRLRREGGDIAERIAAATA